MVKLSTGICRFIKTCGLFRKFFDKLFSAVVVRAGWKSAGLFFYRRWGLPGELRRDTLFETDTRCQGDNYEDKLLKNYRADPLATLRQ